MDGLLKEIEGMQKQKLQFETSIRESNAKQATVIKSISDSKLGQKTEDENEDQDKLEEINKKDKANSAGDADTKVKELQEELADAKRNLNSKMVEMQKLAHEIKVF